MMKTYQQKSGERLFHVTLHGKNNLQHHYHCVLICHIQTLLKAQDLAPPQH
jgi:hypothetical protein